MINSQRDVICRSLSFFSSTPRRSDYIVCISVRKPGEIVIRETKQLLETEGGVIFNLIPEKIRYFNEQ